MGDSMFIPNARRLANGNFTYICTEEHKRFRGWDGFYYNTELLGFESSTAEHSLHTQLKSVGSRGMSGFKMPGMGTHVVEMRIYSYHD